MTGAKWHVRWWEGSVAPLLHLPSNIQTYSKTCPWLGCVPALKLHTCTYLPATSTQPHSYCFLKKPGKTPIQNQIISPPTVTFESTSDCITWMDLEVIPILLGFGWRGWEVLNFGCILNTGFSPPHFVLSLLGKYLLLLFRSSGGPVQHLGSVGFF